MHPEAEVRRSATSRRNPSPFSRVAPSVRSVTPRLFATPRIHTDVGGLLSYFTDLRENFHGAASLVDKILRGANPGDLAILQPDRYFLVLNMKTARALEINVPQSLLLRADEVIE